MTDTLSDKVVEAGAQGVARLRFRFLQWDELGGEVRQMLIAEARAALTAALAALTSANYVILPAEMTAEQAARSLAGSPVAERVRVSSPEIYARMVEARRATWRQMVAVMRETHPDA
jgi:hypothetical protein